MVCTPRERSPSEGLTASGVGWVQPWQRLLPGGQAPAVVEVPWGLPCLICPWPSQKSLHFCSRICAIPIVLFTVFSFSQVPSLWETDVVRGGKETLGMTHWAAEQRPSAQGVPFLRTPQCPPLPCPRVSTKGPRLPSGGSCLVIASRSCQSSLHRSPCLD